MNRHCERSEAIQESDRGKSLDCFVASLLAMTPTEHTFAFSPRIAPELLHRPPSKERAQGMPGALLHPQPCVRIKKAHKHSRHR
jgi:hypothetical protein